MWRARFSAMVIMRWCLGQDPVRLRDKILECGDMKRRKVWVSL